jgi:hypothetical protein
MVKEVLQTNLKLRQQTLELNQQVDQLNADIFHVQGENEELKDKLQIVANVQDFPTSFPDRPLNLEKRGGTQVVPGSPSQASRQSNRQSSPHSVAVCASPHNYRMSVASEMCQLKKDKNLLEQRLRDLERDNINMRATSNLSAMNNSRHFDISGTDDFEPVRSILNGDEVARGDQGGELGRARRSNTKYFRYRSRAPGRDSAEPAKLPRSSYAKLRNMSNIVSKSNAVMHRDAGSR